MDGAGEAWPRDPPTTPEDVMRVMYVMYDAATAIFNSGVTRRRSGSKSWPKSPPKDPRTWHKTAEVVVKIVRGFDEDVKIKDLQYFEETVGRFEDVVAEITGAMEEADEVEDDEFDLHMNELDECVTNFGEILQVT